MKILVLGASGATGSLVVSEMVGQNLQVKALIRSTATFPKELVDTARVEVVRGSISDFSISRIGELVSDCDAVVSCLGHTVSFKGIFGKPRRLVIDAIRKTMRAMEKSGKKHKLILMSTTAYTNRLAGENNLCGEKIIFSLLKLLLPPRDSGMAPHRIIRYSQADAY